MIVSDLSRFYLGGSVTCMLSFGWIKNWLSFLLPVGHMLSFLAVELPCLVQVSPGRDPVPHCRRHVDFPLPPPRRVRATSPLLEVQLLSPLPFPQRFVLIALGSGDFARWELQIGGGESCTSYGQMPYAAAQIDGHWDRHRRRPPPDSKECLLLQQIISSSCYNLLVGVGLNWTDPMRWDAFGGEI